MSTLKKFRKGTDRIVFPSESISRFEPLFPVLGITRIANVTGLDRIGIPVVMVVRPNSRSISVSQGKGVDIEAATISGIMESIEGYHAERVFLPIRRCNFEELRYTENVADINQLPQVKFSKFNINKRLHWVKGIDLINEEEIWVPFELVHTDFTIPKPDDSGCFMQSSNGLAAGNHFSEAVSHAICELVERDAVSLWNHKNERYQESTRVDIKSIDDICCNELLNNFKEAAIVVVIWDATSDIKMPCYICSIGNDTEGGSLPQYPTAGMGCHPSRRIALFRALSEAAQSRLTLISGSRDDLDWNLYKQLLSTKIQEIIKNPRGNQFQLKDFKDSPNFESDTIDDDIVYELEALESSGLKQVIIINLTKQEYNIPVARVIIPGLEANVQSPLYVPGDRARVIIEQNHE